MNEELIYHAWKSLNKGAASGVDKVTADAYAEDLQGNIQRLVERLKMKRYRAKLVRRVYIPKENGKQKQKIDGVRSLILNRALTTLRHLFKIKDLTLYCGEYDQNGEGSRYCLNNGGSTQIMQPRKTDGA